MSRDQIPRLIVVQDENITGDSIYRVDRDGSPEDLEQAGLAVEQPPRDTTIVGDIRPTLSGIPEREAAGDIAVSMAGTEGNLRWGFLQEEADTNADFQVRQSPTVCGRRPDILQYDDGPSYEYYWGNTLVPLINGELLLFFMAQDTRFHSRDPAMGWATEFRLFGFDPESGKWDPSATTITGLGEFGFTGDTISDGPYWIDFDVTQYPDTGELVAVVMGNAISSSLIDSAGSPVTAPLVGAVFHSIDGGVTWEQRSKILFYAIIQEWSAQIFPGIWTVCPSNLGYAKSVSIETSKSGRLIAFVTTDLAVFGLVSDDRGRSWTGVGLATLAGVGGLLQSADTPPEPQVPHCSSSMRRTRNGVLVAAHNAAARVVTTGFPASLSVWMTVDGITWTEAAPVNTVPVPNPTQPYATWIDTAVVQRPDGYVAIYQTLHAYVIPEEGPDTFTWFDEIVMHPMVVRDPSPGDDASGGTTSGPSGIMPYGSVPIHFHLFRDAGRQGADPPNNPTGDVTSFDPPPVVEGFSALALCQYRGQLVAATTMMREPGEESGSNAIVVYRMDYFQPIQERIEPNVEDLADALIATSYRWIAGYGRAWDAYDDPARWGFTLNATGGSSSVQAPNADGGYFGSLVANAQRYWEDDTLPWPEMNHNAVVRCVVQPVSGGSVINPYMVLHLELFDSANFVGWEVRMEVTGADLKFQLHDYFGIIDIGLPLTLVGAAGKYVELLVATWKETASSNPTNVAAYVRVFDPTADPDLLAGYEFIAASTALTETTGPATERLIFGHMDTNSTAQARWKSTAIWRDKKTGSEAFLEYPPLIQRPLTFVDSDGESIRYDAAMILAGPDLGYQNWMRPAQGIAYPAQFFADGLHAEWRGQAAVEGQIAYSSQYIYGAKYLFDKSTPQREWRSNSTTQDIEIVLDAELSQGTGSLFNPRAIGVIGRNWPACKIEFSTTDDFSIPALSLNLGIPGMPGGPYARTTHLLHFDITASATLDLGAYRLRVRTPASNARGGKTFRPHRFRSQRGGQRFYACFINEPLPNRTAIYEISDNDNDTLYLKSNPVADGVASPNEVAIISDRFAWDFSHLMPAGNTGYRFMRLLLESVTHFDTDAAFFRCGSIVLGQPAPFPAGINWGYGISTEPGATVGYAITGAGYSVRNSAMRRQWKIDGPVMRPPNEPATTADMDTDEAVASWRKVSDLTRRVETNGEPCILVMDGIRFAGESSEDGEQLLSDPYDLALVRAATVGDIAHEAYLCREIPEFGVGDETESVPREVAAVRSIAFTEQL